MLDVRKLKADVLREFTSLDEFTEACQPSGDYDGRRSSQATDDRSWYQTKDFSEATVFARYGWSEGGRELDAIRAQVWNTLSKQIATANVGHDVCGFEVDMGAYLIGEPECMLEMTTAEKSAKVVHIVVNAIYSSGVSTKAIMTRGAAICALVDFLEASGIRTQIDVVSVNSPGGRRHLTVVPVKGPQDILDMARVAFACGHPSMLRRMLFSLWENEERDVRSWLGVGGSYGYVGNLKSDEIPEGAVYLDGMHLNQFGNMSESQIVTWVHERLKEQGIEVDVT